jgi:ubiquinone biosynthesis protein
MAALAGPARLAVRTARLLLVLPIALTEAATSSVLVTVVKGHAAGEHHTWRRIAQLLHLLGPAFVKVGQVVATRRDLLTKTACDELSTLQDRVSPLNAAETRRALRVAYGPHVNDLFEHIDDTPVASGSVACVYRARLSSGAEVALKLRRPGIDQQMALDLRLISAVSRLAARLPLFRGLPVITVVNHACDAVCGQLDFERESDNLRMLRANLAAVPRIWVPKIYPDLCVPRCIAMEFIHDLELDAADRCTAAARRRFAASALTAIYHMLFVDGFVHCDMHPGNLYFTENGHVVVLDAGFSVQLSDRLRRLFADFFLNMSLGQGLRCAQIVIESAAALDPRADIDGFTTRMAYLVDQNHGLSARDFSLMKFAAGMFDLQRNHGVHAAPELIFPLLSLLVIEGTIRELDPEVDFQLLARPLLMEGKFAQR